MKDSKKPLNFVLIGPPGCGKGTQAKLLLKKFKNYYYISTGQLFRKLSAAETDVSKKIKKVVESGGLPYDDLATTLWMYDIAFNLRENQGIIADGFPEDCKKQSTLIIFLNFSKEKKKPSFF